MDTDSQPEDPREALQLKLHQLLEEAQDAVKDFMESEAANAKETADDDKRTTLVLKSNEISRLKLKSPEAAERLSIASKAAKSRATEMKASAAVMTAAVDAFTKEVKNAGEKLAAFKAR